MTISTFYPSQEFVVEAHDYLIAKDGGTQGMRDQGALISALMRPQCGYYQDFFEQAAALFESLIFNHPFVDGNKRTALIVLDIFLNANGLYLRIVPKDGFSFINSYIFQASKKTRCKKIFLWIKKNSSEIPS